MVFVKILILIENEVRVRDGRGNPLFVKLLNFINKDCNEQPDPCGNAQIQKEMISL